MVHANPMSIHYYTCNLMCLIFIAIGMCANLWAANPNLQLLIFKVAACKNLKLKLHTYTSKYLHNDSRILSFENYYTCIILQYIQELVQKKYCCVYKCLLRK